ncbi:hypothetical protein BBJ29_002197 [Phytophthora kernoviae]|uniref:Uncharacterized protein n=1 Tax=Phytophthora kernoviae TaxID=325452 RepID=A0A3F2RWK4_9STRA|nr:hypothetical protein BBJ29_002197 [Phytophthora kernoviae]RLN64798.1 hypothetical protein BBP00_00003242 [Phytophthora kernoviae]
MTVKRKRGEAFSAHDKLVHKSCSLLQREAKKVRGFLIRKVVQQLKQLRSQLEEPVNEAKRETRELKLRLSIEKLEREHAALKTLDLQELVKRARLQTGLDKPIVQEQDEQDDEQDEEQWGQESQDEGSTEDEGEQDKEQDEKQDEEAVKQGEQHEGVVKQDEEDHEAVKETAEQKKQDELVERLMDRVFAHKQIVPLLDAIQMLVKKEEREAEKKRRAQEKRALKRGRGGMDDDIDMGMDSYGAMAGADDDIAEFLGEKKKKKNRPGQMARRQKAIRREESLKRKEDRSNGIFRSYQDPSASASKYGPSERPKKAKPKAKSGSKQGDKKPARSSSSKSASKTVLPTQQRAAPAAAAPVEASHPSWLAKQKMKEKEKISMHAFSGKKITFGDD